MKYLTIDTTTKITALALGENDKLITEVFLHTGKNHSERLIPMLHQLLDAAGWTLKDLDFIGVVRGPGSFTGIRIGIATAQGLAQVLDIPLVGVLSLDVISWAGYKRNEDVAVILDARKNEWYAAVYRWNEDLREQVITPQAQTPDYLLRELDGRGNMACFAGDAVKGAEMSIREALGSKAVILPQFQALPRGAYAVQEVWYEYARLIKEGIELTKDIEPYYIRFSEAEVNYRKKMEQKTDSVHTVNKNK